MPTSLAQAPPSHVPCCILDAPEKFYLWCQLLRGMYPLGMMMALLGLNLALALALALALSLARVLADRPAEPQRAVSICGTADGVPQTAAPHNGRQWFSALQIL